MTKWAKFAALMITITSITKDFRMLEAAETMDMGFTVHVARLNWCPLVFYYLYWDVLHLSTITLVLACSLITALLHQPHVLFTCS